MEYRLFENIWYVLESRQNLFSSDAGYKSVSEDADSKLKEFRDKSGNIVAVGIRHSGVYKLLMLKMKENCRNS